jgi:hypothetical protein
MNFRYIYDLPQLKRIKITNRSITSNRIKTVSLPANKSSWLDRFTPEKILRTFKEQQQKTPAMPLKVFHTMKRKGKLPNAFHETSISLYDTEKLQLNFLDEHRHKNSQ